MSVKDKNRLMFAVVDAEINASQFVVWRRMSKEEMEKTTMMTTTTTSGSNSGKQRNSHLKTLAQYLVHRSASQENLGTRILVVVIVVVVVTVLPTKERKATTTDDDDDDDDEEGASSSSSLEMYEILWKADGETKDWHLRPTRRFLHVSRMVQKWSEEAKTAPEAQALWPSNDGAAVKQEKKK